MNTLSEQTLLSQICHEIGNPLTLIYSTIQLMESKHPQFGDLEQWNQLREDVKNLTHLFHELTLYHHSGTIHAVSTDLYEILFDLLDSFESLAMEKNVCLVFDDTNIFLKATEYPCDVIKIRQALTNLLKNAIEAAYDSSTVSITLSPSEHPPFFNKDGVNYLSLTIENNGLPISESDKERIFRPFHTTKPNGTGLGLPITAKIIESHGGSVLVDSTKDRTAFTIYLPIS